MKHNAEIQHLQEEHTATIFGMADSSQRNFLEEISQLNQYLHQSGEGWQECETRLTQEIRHESEFVHSECAKVADQNVLVEHLQHDLQTLGDDNINLREQISEMQDEWNSYEPEHHVGEFQDCQDDNGANGNWQDEAAEFQKFDFASRAVHVRAAVRGRRLPSSCSSRT